MAEQYAFKTREERDAFTAFVEADRVNFEFDVETRLALAWGASREYFTSEDKDRDVKPAAGLSEYVRGFEAGLGEYADRQLRLAALEHAVSSTSPGHSSETVMARAKEYLRFLQEGE